MEHAERTGHAHERHPAGPVEYRRDVESVAFFSDAVFAISCSRPSGSTPVGAACSGTSMLGSTATTRFAPSTLR
jgi:hypothetical protein